MTTPPPSDDEIDALLSGTEDTAVPVMLLIHNGMFSEGGHPQFVPLKYMLPATVLMEVRGLIAPYEAI